MGPARSRATHRTNRVALDHKSHSNLSQPLDQRRRLPSSGVNPDNLEFDKTHQLPLPKFEPGFLTVSKIASSVFGMGLEKRLCFFLQAIARKALHDAQTSGRRLPELVCLICPLGRHRN